MNNIVKWSVVGTAIAVCLILLTLSFVSAAPPVLSTIQSGSLEIIAPTYNYVKVGLDKDIYWHVFNTTALLTNKTVTCSYHLYEQNLKGVHIVYVSNVKGFTNDRDFEVEVKGANFTVGEYCQLIECNTSIQTGGIEICFSVTPTGEGSRIGFYIFIFILAYIILLIGIFTKNIPATILGGFATTLLGLYTLNNGIDIYRNFATEWLSILTMAFGGFWMVKAALEYLEFLD